MQDLYEHFGACSSQNYGSYDVCEEIGIFDAQCCVFTTVETKAQFCVTDKQRAGENEGMYFDHTNIRWSWNCLEDWEPWMPKPREDSVPNEKAAV